MADLEKIAEEISKLSLLEASDLVKMLEDKLGVSAAAPVAMAAMPMAAAAAEPEMLYVEGDGVFEFERTASRLREMQSVDWAIED